MEGKNREVFGYMPDGTPVEEYTLRSGALSCQIITYGGAVRTLTVPDRAGAPVDVVLGFDTLEGYCTHNKYFGALIGRFANRIGGSRFTLGGRKYLLRANEGANHLHGGLAGFDKQVWTAEERAANRLVLSLYSPDGQEGYPGGLSVQVAYTLTGNGLELDYQAECDQDTLCSLTNHSYFNLSGHSSGPAAGQYIQLFAGQYTPADGASIPTGAVEPVDGTPMDLRCPQPIAAHVDDPFGQLALAGGYDHNWVIDSWDGTLRPAARAWSPDTGILMEALTTLPGVQFYSGNALDGCPPGKGGAPYQRRWGFCLETQFFPDTPNHAGFPPAVLRAGTRYCNKTVFRFSTADGPA